MTNNVTLGDTMNTVHFSADTQLEEVNFKVDDIPAKDRTEFVKLYSEYYDRIPLSGDNKEYILTVKKTGQSFTFL